ITLPTTPQLADDVGLDLDGDGEVDNAIGNFLPALIALSGGSFDLQGAIDDSVDDGTILLLADLFTPSLTDASSATFTVAIGANPSPTPCTDPDDPTTCRQHLDGNGTFDVKPGQFGGVDGAIADGTFTNPDPGTLTLDIQLAGVPASLALSLAHAEISDASD